MLVGLVPALLALASTTLQSDILLCHAWFNDGGRNGVVQLMVDPEYRPQALTVSIWEPDGWSRATITLDPSERRLPGLLSGAFFAVRFTRPPVFPLTMSAYADGTLRWRKEIRTPFWPTTLGGSAESLRTGRNPGTSDYLAGADDGLPVPTPRELRIVLIDARGQEVGESRYALPGAEPGPVATALAAVEAGYGARTCSMPTPPPD